MCGTTDTAFNETDGWSNSLTFAVSMDLLGFAGKLNWKLMHTGRESVEAKKKVDREEFFVQVELLMTLCE